MTHDAGRGWPRKRLILAADRGKLIPMRRRALAALVAVVALVGWSGTASAQTGPQRFVLYQGPGEENFTVYASGPISGVGTDYLLTEGVDASGRTRRTTESVFPQGSTFNTLTVLENSLTFDPRTCVARIIGRSLLDITGGTGAYEGVTGSGETTFQAIVIAERTPEGCSRTNTKTHAIAYTTGTTSLPA